MDRNTSKTITALRFPLITAVVLLHTYIINRPIGGIVYVKSGQFPLFDLFSHVYQSEFANISVPLFFFISGYLFFVGFSSLEWGKFKAKWKKRVHTLLIPFFIWNVTFMLFVECVHIIAPSLLTCKKVFAEMTFSEIIGCFWDLNQGLIPLWFIRDLMIINLFSPIIYVLLRNRYSKIIILGFTILFLSEVFHYEPGVGMRCAYPYMLGAWFSINSKDFILVFKRYRIPLSVILLVLVSFDTFLWTKDIFVFSLNRFAQIVGIITIPLWFSYGIEKGKLRVNEFLARGSFFVFVFHMFIIYIPAKLWVYILPVNGWTATLALVTIPILVSYVCLGIYKMLTLMIPKMMMIVMGDRKLS